MTGDLGRETTARSAGGLTRSNQQGSLTVLQPPHPPAIEMTTLHGSAADHQAAQAGSNVTPTIPKRTVTYAIVTTVVIVAVAIVAVAFSGHRAEGPAGRSPLCAPRRIDSRGALDEVAAACGFDDLLLDAYPHTTKMLYRCDTSLLHGEFDPEDLDYEAGTLHTKYGDVVDTDIGDGCELVPSAVDFEYCTADVVPQGYCLGSGVDYTALAYGRGPGQSCEDWEIQATVWEEGYDPQYVSLLEYECSGSDSNNQQLQVL